jgi:hypothetical protein
MTVVASNFERKENELYETEAWATNALLRWIPVRGMYVWEPAAGNHAMADVLRENGATVFTSDITTYSREHDKIIDFLCGGQTIYHGDAIITNPPYGKGNRQAVRFAEQALEACKGYVALLLTAKFDFGKTRSHLFKDNPRFFGKIALVDRISWAGNGETGTEDHAWYIWRPRHHNPEPPVMIWEGKE